MYQYNKNLQDERIMPEQYASVIKKLEEVVLGLNDLTHELRSERDSRARVEKSVEDHEERIRSLEFNQAQLLQIKIILGVIGVSVAGVAIRLFFMG